MKPLAFALIALIAWSAAETCSAKYVPNLYPNSGFSVVETTWEGPDGNHFTLFHFEKGGKLTYSYSGNAYDNGKWTQSGDTVYFELNNKFREFRGRITETTLEGESWNETETWKTKLKRK